MIKIAHISDLHFSQITWRFSSFSPKRWLGNLNFFLFRRKSLQQDSLDPLISLLEREQVQYVFVSGDLTSSSLPEEFLLAKIFFTKLQDLGIKTFFVPGNHDAYTKKAFKNKTFYEYFSNLQKNPFQEKFSLKHEGVEAIPLENPWWVVGLDVSLKTSLFSSQGFFSPTLEKNFSSLLEQLPSHAKILLVSHFPFTQNPFVSLRKSLLRKNAFKKSLQKFFPKISVYFHGHTHTPRLLDLRKKNLPVVVDSGSCTLNPKASFQLLELFPNHCSVKTYHWKTSNWNLSKTTPVNL